eukprot:4046920-Pleurochrysis_carterae.AAC.3
MEGDRIIGLEVELFPDGGTFPVGPATCSFQPVEQFGANANGAEGHNIFKCAGAGGDGTAAATR